MIRDHDRDHCFGHLDEAREQAWVVAAFGADGRRVAGLRDGFLFDGQAACRFDRGSQNDRQACRDAAEHAAVTIGRGGNAGMAVVGMLRIGNETVVVFAAAHRDAAEADAVFDTEYRGQTEERFGEIGFNLIEDRFAQSRRDIGRDDFRRAADGIAFFPDVLDQRDHRRRGRGIGATDNVG